MVRKSHSYFSGALAWIIHEAFQRIIDSVYLLEPFNQLVEIKEFNSQVFISALE